MPKAKKSNRGPNPLGPAPDQVGGRLQQKTQSRELGRPSKPLLDSRLRGNERMEAAAVARICADDEPVPADIDEFRRRLTRKILTMLRMYRRCRAPICRRIKRCAGPDFRCQRDFPLRNMTPEKQARAMTALSHALQRRIGTG